MTDIFDYSDYRSYLADYYQEEKARRPSFSYQHLATRAGFRNKGFLYNIIQGHKNISRSSVYKLSRALKHTRAEAEYFGNLVAFNQATDVTEQTHFYEAMEAVKHAGRATSQAQTVRRDQYRLYSQWYYSVVRSLIDLYGFTGDYTWLARAVSPPITVTQARHAVETLVRLGLVSVSDDGTHTVVHKTITTGPQVQSLAVLNLHLDMMDKAADAVRTLPRDVRNVSGLLLGISPKTYDRICDEVQELQKRILAMAEEDSQADRVYQCNFHLFPVSRTDLKGRTQ